MTTIDESAPEPADAPTPRTARERARRELTAEIKAIARRQLAEEGPAALSLRAVARELGMVSSAVYRYFASRDELLTALIIDAYHAVADVAAASQDPAATHRRRWMALTGAIRGWAIENPHEYALIYGTPVPGYAAPVDTVDPAVRVSLVVLELLADAVDAGEVQVGDGVRMPKSVRTDLARMRDELDLRIPDAVLSRGLLAWTAMFGTISFELFGHLHNVIDDYDAFFEVEMGRAWQLVAGSEHRASD